MQSDLKPYGPVGFFFARLSLFFSMASIVAHNGVELRAIIEASTISEILLCVIISANSML